MMVIDPYRFAVATPTVALTDSGTDADNLDTYTFADKAIGTASSTRLVVVGVFLYDSGNNAVSGVTIGGSAATEVAQTVTNDSVCAIFQRVVTSGTTASIVVTAANTAQSCGVAVYKVDGYTSSTATDTDAAIDGDPMTDLLNVSAGGVAIAVSGCESGTSATWAGLTEDLDTTIGPLCFTAASGSFATAQTNLTIGPNYAGSDTNQSIAMAAWR